MKNLDKIYSVAQSEFFFKYLYKARKKLFRIIVKYVSNNHKIIDVGTAPLTLKHENFFLNHYEFKENITCLSNQNLEDLKKVYPKLNTILGDGRDIDLEDNSFDISISNATLEHVGSFEEQTAFVKELYRICKIRTIIIIPYRFFPLDTHSMLPFIHWLPKKIHRKILKIFNYNFLAEEKNLNLLSKKDLIQICNKNNITNYKIIGLRFFGFVSNLILIINKQ